MFFASAFLLTFENIFLAFGLSKSGSSRFLSNLIPSDELDGILPLKITVLLLSNVNIFDEGCLLTPYLKWLNCKFLKYTTYEILNLLSKNKVNKYWFYLKNTIWLTQRNANCSLSFLF